MESPLQAQVECTDGVCGQSEYVLVNPVTEKVTHIVVKEDESPNTEYIVPVEMVSETMGDTIQLHCSKADVEKMEPFVRTTYIKEVVPDRVFGYAGGMYGIGSYYYLPYVTPDKTVYTPVESQQIPPGELAIRRGTKVEATDGHVGKVDELVIDPETGHITHVVMREGHLWGKKDVIIPVSAIGDTHDDTVYLDLDKQQIDGLPTFPLHRRWS